MSLNEHIKRPFLTTAIVVLLAFLVFSSTFSIKSTYAEVADVYRPSYTWHERPQRTFQAPDFSKYANPIQDPIAFQAPDFSKYAYPIQDSIAFQALDFSKYAYPIQEPIAFQAPDFRKYANPIQDPIAFQAPDFSKYANPIQDPIAYDQHMRSFETKFMGDMERIAQNSILSNPDVYRPSYTSANRITAFGEGYGSYLLDQATMGLSGMRGVLGVDDRMKSLIERSGGYEGIALEDLAEGIAWEFLRLAPIVGQLGYQEYIHNHSVFAPSITEHLTIQEYGNDRLRYEPIQTPRYEPIQMPRYEPIQMPRYEPIHIPQVPMPVYQPPAIPNF